MERRLWLTLSGVALAGAILTTACSAPIDCAAPHAQVPATATAGQPLTVEVEGLFPECQAEAQRFDSSIVRGQVTVTLENATGEVVVATTSPIIGDSSATVVLDIPAAASGSYQVRTQGADLGTVSVEPPEN